MEPSNFYLNCLPPACTLYVYASDNFMYLVTEKNIEALVQKVRPIFALNVLKYAAHVALNLCCSKVLFY